MPHTSLIRHVLPYLHLIKEGVTFPSEFHGRTSKNLNIQILSPNTSLGPRLLLRRKSWGQVFSWLPVICSAIQRSILQIPEEGLLGPLGCWPLAQPGMTIRTHRVCWQWAPNSPSILDMRTQYLSLSFQLGSDFPTWSGDCSRQK